MRRKALLAAASAAVAAMASSACGSGKKEQAAATVPPAASADVAMNAYGKVRGAQQGGVGQSEDCLTEHLTFGRVGPHDALTPRLLHDF